MSRTPEFEMVADASKALHYGLHDVAHKVALLIKSEAWRQFKLPNGKTVEHESFAAFVATKPPQGLGTDAETILRVCKSDTAYFDIVDQALQRPIGRPLKSDNITNIEDPNPRGTSSQGALRRLRKDRPDLHEKVLAGELSAHAAMVDAGFRRKTITVPAEVVSAARAIQRHFSPDDITALVRLLTGQ